VCGVVAVSKQNVSATVDDDVYEFLQQEHINTSGLINRCLKEYMNTGGDVSAVRDLRIQQLEDEAADLASRASKKRERAEELREALETKQEEAAEETLQDILDDAANTPADPTHPHVVDHADAADMTPEELAREIADYHDKEYDPFNDDTPESLK